MLTGTLAPGVSYAFTDRHGGVSPPPYDTCNLSMSTGDTPANVAANRAAVAARLGVDQVLFMNQVHGANIVVADGPWAERAPHADGVATTTRGLALGVLAADCAPVLVADPVARVIAAVHVGRAGLAAGTVRAAVSTMKALGASPDRTVAVIGPAVCGRCYEVPGVLQEEVVTLVPAARAWTRTGSPALDIVAGVTAQLGAAGAVSISHAGQCTMEATDHYSHRRERLTGRFAGIVWLS